MSNYLVPQIEGEIAAAGISMVTFEAMEFAGGAPFADVDALIAALDAFVAAKDWLRGYNIDHARGIVLFDGPKVPYTP